MPGNGAGGERMYALGLANQPGTDGMPVHVIVRAPEGVRIAAPGDWSAKGDGRFGWSGRLVQDVVLVLRLRAGDD